MKAYFLLFSFFLLSFAAEAAPNANTLLILKNQFGEQSNNFVLSNQLPLKNDMVLFSTATTPANGPSGDGAGYAGKGSLCAARDTGVLYNNTGTKASPTWVANAASISLLQNGQFTPQTETVSGAGALSTTKMESIVSNGTAGTYAVTLAAPSSQDGQIKVIKLATATHTVTLAMTNISISGGFTGVGTTTLTFTSTGDSAVFIAVGTKWVYLGGTAVAS